MPYRSAAAIAAAFFVSTAQAAVVSTHVTAECSGSFNVSNTAGLSWRCEGGDLSVVGQDGLGFLGSDVAIELFASGKLSLAGMTLTAPVIKLAGDEVFLGQDIVLDAGDTHVSGTRPITQRDERDIVNWNRFDIGGDGGSVTISPGANISVGAVPEPGALALFCVGMLAMGARLRR